MADPRYLGKDKNGYNIYQLPDGSTSAPTTMPPNIEQRAAYNQVNSEPKASTGDITTSSSPATATIPVFNQNQANQNLATTDTGTDAPVVTTTQTQSTPAPPNTFVPNSVVATADETAAVNAYIAAGGTFPRGTGPITSGPLFDAVVEAKASLTARQEAAAANAQTEQPTAPGKPGNNTNDDASINNTKSGTNTIYNAATMPGSPTAPRDNVLDQYASYTYGLSLYLLTADQYKKMSATSKINTNEWSLLIQTGGAPPPVVPAAPAPATAPGNGTLFKDTGAGTTTNSFGQTVNNNLASGV